MSKMPSVIITRVAPELAADIIDCAIPAIFLNSAIYSIPTFLQGTNSNSQLQLVCALSRRYSGHALGRAFAPMETLC